jgi:hypothetical protein
MLADGEEFGRVAVERLRQSEAAREREEREYVGRDRTQQLGAKFLQDVSAAVYAGGAETVEDRIKKFRHYRQRGGDALSAEAFLKR